MKNGPKVNGDRELKANKSRHAYHMKLNNDGNKRDRLFISKDFMSSIILVLFSFCHYIRSGSGVWQGDVYFERWPNYYNFYFYFFSYIFVIVFFFNIKVDQKYFNFVSKKPVTFNLSIVNWSLLNIISTGLKSNVNKTCVFLYL